MVPNLIIARRSWGRERARPRGRFPTQHRVSGFTKMGHRIEQRQPLLMIKTPDMVQGQNAFMGVLTRMHKAELQLSGVTKHDCGPAEAASIAAQSHNEATQRARHKECGAVAAGGAQSAAILGKSDAELDDLKREGRIGAETVIAAPPTGTWVSRKVGSGQVVGNERSPIGGRSRTHVAHGQRARR